MIKKFLYSFIIFFLLLILLVLSQVKLDISAAEIEKKYTNAQSLFTDVDGQRVHYRDEGKGIPLILLHGTAASLHTWEEWTAHLKPDFRVIRMDLPAFGLTGPNKNHDYSTPAYTAFLDDFLGKLEIDSCYLAGNSLGGRIAWEYCWRYPGRVKKLILVDASGHKLPGDPEMSIGFKLARTPILSLISRYVTPRSLVEKSVHEVYSDEKKVTKEIVDRYYELLLREGNRDGFIARARHNFDDNTEKLKEIDIPVLIQWGAEDRWVPLSHAHAFVNAMPQATINIYKGVGHIPMEEIPEQTATDARAFLTFSPQKGTQ